MAPPSKKAPAPAPKAKRRLPVSSTTAQKPGPKAKKPKSDKSTNTKTTPTAQTPVNVYDAVLGEAQDLFAAAREAQALGRLKMASTYLMLLHARLVGLGKRFDRAQIQGDPDRLSVASSLRMSPEADSAKAPAAATPDKPPSSPQVEQLANLLPTNIEMDSVMMEHLARAAVELHHKRTGRRIQADSLLASPPPAAGQAVGALSRVGARADPAPGGIAWTEGEIGKVTGALQKGVTGPKEIAALVGTRTEAQVRAYLRLAEQRQKGAQALESELGDESPRKRGGRGRKPPTQAMNTVPNANLDARSLLKGNPL